MHRQLHVSLKMRIPHYTRQRIIKIGNSEEIQGNSGNSVEFKGILGKSDEKLYFFFTRFPRCEIHWVNLIPLISLVATVKTGENSCEKK